MRLLHSFMLIHMGRVSTASSMWPRLHVSGNRLSPKRCWRWTMHLDAYDEQLECEAIAGRYKNIAKAVPHTLERLRQSSTFLTIVEQLRNEGWKDWHIL